ncbi:hypothetical protein BJX62DRAFT_222113 [Aspergillus germanicus]
MAFYTKYGGDAVRRPELKRLMDGAARLLKEGTIEWVRDTTKLREFYMEISLLTTGWSMDYLIDDLDMLSEDRIDAIIASVNGFCVQTDWATLRPMLPPTVRENSAHVFGELLVYLAIKVLFENPFWYLDGKRGPSDPGEDPTFAEKLNYPFERFYQRTSLTSHTNPQYAVLWRMYTQRLSNSPSIHFAPNPTFGKANGERYEAALPTLADKFLASEPLCWLLKEKLSPDETEARRAELIDIFRKGIRMMIACETWTNGIPVFRGIDELGGVLLGDSKFLFLHPYCYRPKRDLYTNQEIIFGSYIQMTQGAVEVIDAEVIPKYVEETPDGAAEAGVDVVKDGDEDEDEKKDDEAEAETDNVEHEDEVEDGENDEENNDEEHEEEHEEYIGEDIEEEIEEDIKEDSDVEGDLAADDEDWVEGESN